MTCIIQKVNTIPMHCVVAYESVHSFARGHVIRVILQNSGIMGVFLAHCLFLNLANNRDNFHTLFHEIMKATV